MALRETLPHAGEGIRSENLSPPDYLDWQARARSFEAWAPSSGWTRTSAPRVSRSAFPRAHHGVPSADARNGAGGGALFDAARTGRAARSR